MRKTYIFVWGALLILLGATVAAAQFHLGYWNPVIAVALAMTKAVIIAVYFMHLKSSPRVIWIAASVGLVWLAILFMLTTTDYVGRPYLPRPSVWTR